MQTLCSKPFNPPKPTPKPHQNRWTLQPPAPPVAAERSLVYLTDVALRVFGFGPKANAKKSVRWESSQRAAKLMAGRVWGLGGFRVTLPFLFRFCFCLSAVYGWFCHCPFFCCCVVSIPTFLKHIFALFLSTGFSEGSPVFFACLLGARVDSPCVGCFFFKQ